MPKNTLPRRTSAPKKPSAKTAATRRSLLAQIRTAQRALIELYRQLIDLPLDRSARKPQKKAAHAN